MARSSEVLADVPEELDGRGWCPFNTLTSAVGTQHPPQIDALALQLDAAGLHGGVWVALEDMDMDNGPLVYYPGSHKLPSPTGRDRAPPGRRRERTGERMRSGARHEQYGAYCRR